MQQCEYCERWFKNKRAVKVHYAFCFDKKYSGEEKDAKI
jgi:hypothetical protein